MKILYLKRFERQFKKLSIDIQLLAVEKENIFKANPFDPCLKTHKLHGKFQGLWAFSVDQSVRIIFEFKKNQTVWYYSIGYHNIYE